MEVVDYIIPTFILIGFGIGIGFGLIRQLKALRYVVAVILAFIAAIVLYGVISPQLKKIPPFSINLISDDLMKIITFNVIFAGVVYPGVYYFRVLIEKLFPQNKIEPKWMDSAVGGILGIINGLAFALLILLMIAMAYPSKDIALPINYTISFNRLVEHLQGGTSKSPTPTPTPKKPETSEPKTSKGTETPPIEEPKTTTSPFYIPRDTVYVKE